MQAGLVNTHRTQSSGTSEVGSETERRRGRVVAFGEFQADFTALELRKGGRRVKIQDLPLRLLLALVERPGETIAHDEFRTLLWGDTIVDFEAGLHTAVRKLREALGDSATQPKYIETVPRHGYRFMAPVESVVVPGAWTSPASESSRMLPYAAIAVLLVVIALGISLYWQSPSLGGGAPVEIVPLVAESGLVRSPALSPDGRRVAFCWAREAGESLNLYVQEIDGSARKRLTSSPTSDRFPSWSPDGSQIAFVRDRQVFLIPAGGGLESRLTTAEESGIAWSPDSRHLAVADREVVGGSNAIFLVDTQTGERRNLSNPASSALEDRWPSFSPDGRQVAFSRNATTMTEIYIASVDGETQERVVRDLGSGRNLTGLVWSPRGTHLLLAIGRLGLFSISATAREATTVSRIAAAGEDVGDPSLILDPVSGEISLAYSRERFNWDIYGMSLRGDAVVPTIIQNSTRADDAPAISPDGKRLAFTSLRSGTPELWLSNLDGTATTRVTHFGTGAVGTPQWAPDAKRLVFDATIDGNRDIYTVATDGTQVQRLTTEPSAEGQASWSRDGKSIYFMSDRSGDRQVWKMASDGNAPFQLTKGGGYQAFESPDGKTVYYARRQQDRGIWSIPADGGREQLVSEAARHNLWGLAEDGIYYFDLDGLEPAVFEFPQSCPIRKQDYRSGEVTTVAVISTNLPWSTPGLGISSDGSTVTWISRHDSGGELLLIHNLRLN